MCSRQATRYVSTLACVKKQSRCLRLQVPYKRHELERSTVQEVVCALCDKRQPIGAHCSSCGVAFGAYYCTKVGVQPKQQAAALLAVWCLGRCWSAPGALTGCFQARLAAKPERDGTGGHATVACPCCSTGGHLAARLSHRLPSCGPQTTCPVMLPLQPVLLPATSWCCHLGLELAQSACQVLCSDPPLR